MFGNSKHYSVQPPLLYKPAEMTNKPLTAKYFIYDVVVWPLFYSFLVLPFTFREAIFSEFTAKIATQSGLYPFLMNLAIRMQNICLGEILALRFCQSIFYPCREAIIAQPLV